ncbi:VanZ family protein [Oceanicoccus sp. KOV_DT_Chl]|uniref:VanZ family protein n=1 Tax=Oceanicoccus sp. KOV_DT_Chl TaxID=1904639 RepID=UPI000C7980E1|nr:VanZ family protein [Oceanicoccus sp. KOV_DT_Chl]
MLSISILSRCGFILALTAITVLALAPQEQATVSLGWDKANHCVAFFVLFVLLDLGYPSRHMWLAKLLPLFSYGVLIELIQLFLPYREGSAIDLVANLFGLLLYQYTRYELIKRSGKDLSGWLSRT